MKRGLSTFYICPAGHLHFGDKQWKIMGLYRIGNKIWGDGVLALGCDKPVTVNRTNKEAK